MKQQIKDVLKLVEPLAKKDGFNDTNIAKLKIVKYSQKEKIENVYLPSICLVLQGQKDTILGEEIYRYQSGEYVLASAQLPVTGNIVTASKDKPYIGLFIEFDPVTVIEILKDLPSLRPSVKSQRALYVSKSDETLLNAFVRLVDCLDNLDQSTVLAPLIIKEIIFRLVISNQGDVLRQFGMVGTQAAKVRAAISDIVTNYAGKIDINHLASKVGMSPSSFHQHFKDVTAMSPLQYQKNVRLLEARRLLVSGPDDAATVAFKVGYESPSQFSREYARFYGAPPKADRERLKKDFEKK